MPHFIRPHPDDQRHAALYPVAACCPPELLAVHQVTGAREGAEGFRTKRVDVYDHTLARSVQTGLHFERPAAAAKPADDAEDADDGFDALASESTL